MKVNILASGSSGNCIALTVDDNTILIDVGIAKTKIEKALLAVDIRPDDVQAIFVTHAHKDHTKGLPLANKYMIPVYAGEDEWKDIQGVDEELINDIDTEIISFSEMNIYAFNVHHDARDPVGYAVRANGIKVSVCLDTGKVDETMLLEMRNSDIYIIEANHEPKMVELSDYPNSVKTRILSDIGHLSNDQTGKALAKLIQGKGEQIYLTHLSSNNNMPVLAESKVKRELSNKGFIEDKHYKIEVV